MLNRNQREGENNIKLALEHTRRPQASETTRKVHPQATFLTKCLREEDKSSSNNDEDHEKRVLIAIKFMNNSHHRE